MQETDGGNIIVMNPKTGDILAMVTYPSYNLNEPYTINNEELLYKLFGVNAELLIDHAWGIEPCTIEDIHKYHSYCF